MDRKLCVWFSQIDKSDLGLVGGKGANTGEMVKAGFPVPPGFIVTSKAYYEFLEKSGLRKKIQKIIAGLNVENPEELHKVSQAIKKEIVNSEIPPEICTTILEHYTELAKRIAKKTKYSFKKFALLFKDPLVAIRSSATAEDLPDASFAGQQESYLNIHGESNVVNAVRKCWASLFEARAIYYRKQNNFDHFKVGIAVLVQQMVESDASGVMFTIDPTSNQKNKVVIESIYGLGEYIVQGIVTPDHYEIEKSSLDILKKEISKQKNALFLRKNKNIQINIKPDKQEKQKIKDLHIIELARLGKQLEKHYYFPQDVEWAIEKDKVYIVQTRPITTIEKTTSNISSAESVEKNIHFKLPLLLTGSPASPGLAYGPAQVLLSAREINKIDPGEILVAPQTNPDYVPAMKKAAAIVTDKGGRTSHAAIVSRELGIPCIVGTENATKLIKDGMSITVDATNGKVYKGSLTSEQRKIVNYSHTTFQTNSPHLKTATKIYVNLAEPQISDLIAKKNVDGIGLLRAEFMIANIGVHPKKLIHEKKSQFFINKLAGDIALICKNFAPRPVIYRATDFKTNEYRNLKGGIPYEPEEPNPMLGYRGAYRYIHDPQVFKLEIEAIKKVRHKLNLKNLHLMIPFVRTVKELIEVKKILASMGLSRSSSFKLWMMVEIPSNVILLEKFIEAGLDGVSIGSNDLTMLILGTDRDNSEVAPEFDERNEAVLWALEKIIKTANKFKITSSICGQAPSDYPDLTEKLVSWGITSISVNPDVIEKTREIVYEAEKRKVNK